MTDADKKDVKQIMTDVLANFWESVFPTLATKEDLKTLATKADVQEVKQDLSKLDHKVDVLSRDVKEIRRRVIDLETDTPTKSEFKQLETRVDQLTN